MLILYPSSSNSRSATPTLSQNLNYLSNDTLSDLQLVLQLWKKIIKSTNV